MGTARFVAGVGAALAAIGVLVAATTTPATAASAYGCQLSGDGNTAMPQQSPQPDVFVGGESCQFTAGGPVAFAGVGNWTIIVTHASGAMDTYTGVGVPNAGSTTAVAGDTVFAEILAPGGSLALGTDPTSATP